MGSRFRRLALALVALALALPGGSAPPTAADRGDRLHRWFSVPLRVEKLPPGAELVPVSCEIDFTALLQVLKVPGAVDLRSLRLLRSLGGRGEVEEPVQLRAAPQPRPKKRQLLPGTPAAV